MRPKKYNSEAERQKAYRARKEAKRLSTECEAGKVTIGVTKPDNVTRDEANVTEPVVVVTKPVTDGMTATDALFEAENPGYLIYEGVKWDRKCAECGKGYSTRLEMNRFCGPECKQEMIRRLSTVGGRKAA